MPRAYDQTQLVVDRDPLKQLDPSLGNLPKMSVGAIWEQLVEGIRLLTGVDLSSPQALFDSIADIIGDALTDLARAIVGAITGIPGAIEDLVIWVRDSVTDLGGIVSGLLGESVYGLVSGTGKLVDWFLGLIGFQDVHSAASLLGTGQLGKVNPELLINGSFDNETSMPPGGIGGWVWDGTVDHTGKDESGSAKVVANGSTRSMLSNAIDVVDSNVINASVWVKWTGRTGTGPVALALNVYNYADKLIDTAVFETSSVSANSDWVQLSGQYVVPELIANQTPTHVCAAFLVDAGVTGGTFWWDDASIRKINPVSHKLVDGFQDVVENVTEKAGAGLTDFIDALKSFDRIKTGTIVDNFIPGIGLLLENGIRGLLGLPPETGTYTHDEFLEAGLAQAQSAVGNRVSIALIWQYLNAGVYDEFERAGNNLGSNWATPWGSGNGTLKTEGHNAALPFQWPGGNSEWFTRWVGTNASSTSDYQQNSVVLASASGSSLGYSGYNDVLGRVGGSTHYIRFRVGGDGSWSVMKFVNGTGYIMQHTDGTLQRGLAGAIKRPGPGSILTLYCGDKTATNLTHFKAMINNEVIADFDEKTGVAGVPDSVYGSSYRGRGFGLRAEGIPFLAGWVSPGLVNYWSGSDQP